MDPCCGSATSWSRRSTCCGECGWRRRGCPEAAAADAVIRDNLYGLELDPRCTQIAAFALAFAAWKAGGYRQLPVPNIACSGIAVSGQLEEWTEAGRRRPQPCSSPSSGCIELFQDAPTLGSLIDPADVP